MTQPSSEVVSPGGTVLLPCTLEGSYTVSGNRVVWIQQRPGSVPRFLLYFFTESNKGMGTGVPSRFSGSRSSSDKIGYLTITGALEEDDAIYYCVTWTGSACTVQQSYGEVRQKPAHSTAACDNTRPALSTSLVRRQGTSALIALTAPRPGKTHS